MASKAALLPHFALCYRSLVPRTKVCMRAFLTFLWLVLAAGWLSGIVFIAKLIGGSQYIAHVGQSRPVAMLALMGALCFAAALALALAKRLPRALSIAIATVGGLHLVNAMGAYMMYITNGTASPALMLPFVLLASVIPTSTMFVGMPVGNASLLLLPAVTLSVLAGTSFLSRRAHAPAETGCNPPLTRSRVIRVGSGAALLLVAYLGFLRYSEWDAHRTRKQGESWTLFERERYEREASYGEKLRGICGGGNGRGITRHPTTTAVGLRILETKALPESTARGWESGLAFFLGGETGSGTVGPATIIEGLQTAVRRIDSKRDSALNTEPPFIEYQAADGRWKRYARVPGTSRYAAQDAEDTLATRGLRIVQIKTGLEISHTIYGGRLEFVDLATGTIVGEHESYAMDRYYGAHNNYALIAAARCSALPHMVDFITNQLAPHFVSDPKKHFVF